jgi:hypothetical protein
MQTETIRDPYVFQQPPSLPQTMESELFRGESHPSSFDPPSGCDADLLLAALESLEAQRVAIEWLLDADLLWTCMP